MVSVDKDVWVASPSSLNGQDKINQGRESKREKEKKKGRIEKQRFYSK